MWVVNLQKDSSKWGLDARSHRYKVISIDARPPRRFLYCFCWGCSYPRLRWEAAMRPATCSLAREPVSTLTLLPLAILTLIFLSAPDAIASPGKWATSADSSNGDPLRYAVHMALLRSQSVPFHSRILWFRGQETGFHGAEWGWLPGNDGCNSFPGNSFVRVSPDTASVMPNAPGMDIFCAGHTGLADGRLFVPGGTNAQSGYYARTRPASSLAEPGTGTAPGATRG